MTASHSAPPEVLDRDLEVGVKDWTESQLYHVTTALVIPRPVGWISTVSAAGHRNLAPYSYFNLLGTDPFYVAFGSSGAKNTVGNLAEVPQFVCNIATMHLIDQVEFTATDFPPGEDEFNWAGLTPAPSVTVKPHRVAEAKAHLECEVAQIIKEGDVHIVLGRILHVHVDRSVWRSGRVDPRLLDPLCRLSGGTYASLGDIYGIKRKSWEELKGLRDGQPGARAELPHAQPVNRKQAPSN